MVVWLKRKKGAPQGRFSRPHRAKMADKVYSAAKKWVKNLARNVENGRSLAKFAREKEVPVSSLRDAIKWVQERKSTRFLKAAKGRRVASKLRAKKVKTPAIAEKVKRSVRTAQRYVRPARLAEKEARSARIQATRQRMAACTWAPLGHNDCKIGCKYGSTPPPPPPRKKKR